MPSSYYETLKTQLDTAATAKKAALDAAYLRATSATFDASGKLTGYQDNKPGSLDVQQQENIRTLGVQNESSGMLRSGQYARELASSEAGYRSKIADLGAETTAAKDLVTNENLSELAKYKAMYDNTATTSAGTGTGGGTGTRTGTGTETSTSADTSTDITAPPVFTAAPAGTPVVVDKKTGLTTQNGIPASSAANFRMKEEADKKLIAKMPLKKAVPAKSVAPKVSNKIKTLK